MTDASRLPAELHGLRIGSHQLSAPEFLAAIRDYSYPAAAFHHLDHLRLGWLVLERLPFQEAQAELCGLIRNFVTHLGKEDRYHETVTRAWAHLLASHDESTFEEFATVHGERASAKLLYQFWSAEVLGSDDARKHWVEPDIQPLPMLRWRTP
jgi:hypothetical protein